LAKDKTNELAGLFFQTFIPPLMLNASRNAVNTNYPGLPTTKEDALTLLSTSRGLRKFNLTLSFLLLANGLSHHFQNEI